MSIDIEHPSSATSGARAAADRGLTASVVVDELLAFLLAPAAVFVALGGLLIGAIGPSEQWETRLWVLAVVVALPAGMALARRQRSRVGITPMGTALTAAALTAGIALRWAGSGTTTWNLVLGLSGLAAAAAPFAAAAFSSWAHREDAEWRAVTWAAIAIAVIPFLPSSATSNHHLFNGLLVAAGGYAALRLAPMVRLGRRTQLAIDVVAAGVLFLVVFQTPVLSEQGYLLVHHHNFYLGPVNDAAHGRDVLASVWSQYGIGMIVGLQLAFTAVPLSYGGLVLIGTFATALQYVVLYATLRAATGRMLIVLAAVATSAFAEVFDQLGSSLDYPSTGPLRFGPPYLVIGLAVWAALAPRRARVLAWAQVLVVAGAALWSFETGVYSIATITAISVVERLTAASGTRAAFAGIARDLLKTLAAVAAALLLLTAIAALSAGSADWTPYIDYIKLYQKGLGAVPVVFFSAGPLMGALTLLSAAGLGWLALERRVEVPPPARVAAAGFTGFAMATYTYYLGRSVPQNITHILPPVIAYLTVWCGVFLDAQKTTSHPGPRVAAAALGLACALVAVTSWHAVEDKWKTTALAQTVPFADGGAPGSGRSFRQSLRTLWHEPVMDPRSVDAEALIARHWKPGAPVLSLMASDLTTETLMRAGRRNLLPMSHPAEDDLIADSAPRVMKAVAKVPAGTLMLLNDATIQGPPPGFVELTPKLEADALAGLRQRFTFHTIDRSSSGVSVIRLDARP